MNMNEKKIVTWEMFKKYHEMLVGEIKDGDGLELDVELDSPEDDIDTTKNEKI